MAAPTDASTTGCVVSGLANPTQYDGKHRKSQDSQSNGVVQPLLTDLYQITMAYAYWKCNKHRQHAVFDMFFRKNPFSGEFTVFCGLEECLKFVKNFKYSDSDIEYLRSVIPSADERYFEYLKTLSGDDVAIYAITEGSLVFPRVPLIRVEGALITCQLLETTLLTLVNYASLVATNAARFRLAAGDDKMLLEFGLRRAQGPDGGLSASKYCYIGGFDATSNVMAGKVFGIPVKGTHAHSFVTAFSGLSDLPLKDLTACEGVPTPDCDFLSTCLSLRSDVAQHCGVIPSQMNEGELASFITYAISFPTEFLALVDTYDVSRSGVPNFCVVALALCKFGYRARGIRLDSGDLAYLSTVVRNMFRTIAKAYNLDWFSGITIVASNDINEDTLHSLRSQERDGVEITGDSARRRSIRVRVPSLSDNHTVDHLVELVELDGRPCIKLSQEPAKITMPGKKNAFRLYGQQNYALVDLLTRADEPSPKVGDRVLVRHAFDESKRAYVSAKRVDVLTKCFWRYGELIEPTRSLEEIKKNVVASLLSTRQDHLRPLNPTPYKVSVSDRLYHYIHGMWLENAPIGELS